MSLVSNTDPDLRRNKTETLFLFSWYVYSKNKSLFNLTRHALRATSLTFSISFETQYKNYDTNLFNLGQKTFEFIKKIAIEMSQFTTPPVGQAVIGNGIRGVPPM